MELGKVSQSPCLLWIKRQGRKVEKKWVARQMGSSLHLLALAKANGGREDGSERLCRGVKVKEVSVFSGEDDEVVGGRAC